jgi:hypothetical protein
VELLRQAQFATTAGLSYTGVYYAAALNRAGIATLEVDQWGGHDLPGGASSRPKELGDMLPDVAGAYRLASPAAGHRRAAHRPHG